MRGPSLAREASQRASIAEAELSKEKAVCIKLNRMVERLQSENQLLRAAVGETSYTLEKRARLEAEEETRLAREAIKVLEHTKHSNAITIPCLRRSLEPDLPRPARPLEGLALARARGLAAWPMRGLAPCGRLWGTRRRARGDDAWGCGEGFC